MAEFFTSKMGIKNSPCLEINITRSVQNVCEEIIKVHQRNIKQDQMNGIKVLLLNNVISS